MVVWKHVSLHLVLTQVVSSDDGAVFVGSHDLRLLTNRVDHTLLLNIPLTRVDPSVTMWRGSVSVSESESDTQLLQLVQVPSQGSDVVDIPLLA